MLVYMCDFCIMLADLLSFGLALTAEFIKSCLEISLECLYHFPAGQQG